MVFSMFDNHSDEKLKRNLHLKVTCDRCKREIAEEADNTSTLSAAIKSSYCHCSVPVRVAPDNSLSKQSIESNSSDAPSIPSWAGEPLSDQEKKTRNLYQFMGVILIIASIMCFLYQQYMMDKAQKSVNWPTVQGQIIKNDMVGSKLELLYKYKVGGQEFKNNRFFIGVHTGSKSENSYIMEQHPVGSGAEVHYNPETPGESCLQPGLTSASKIFSYISSGLFFLLGIIAICITFGGKEVLKSLNISNEEARKRATYGHFIYDLAKATGSDPRQIMIPGSLLLVAIFLLIYYVSTHFLAK